MKWLEEYLSNFLLSYNEKEILESLRRLDMDKDGKISEDEFKYYLETYGEKLKPEMMNEIFELAQVDFERNIDIWKFSKNLTVLN